MLRRGDGIITSVQQIIGVVLAKRPVPQSLEHWMCSMIKHKGLYNYSPDESRWSGVLQLPYAVPVTTPTDSIDTAEHTVRCIALV